MVCNNPSGECECPRPEFCKWFGPPKKPKSKGFKKSKAPSLRKTRLSQSSATGKKIKEIYAQLRKVFLAKNPRCWVREECCTVKATQVHHKAGRGKNTNRVETFVAICHECHVWVHQHPNEAREKGWIE